MSDAARRNRLKKAYQKIQRDPKFQVVECPECHFRVPRVVWFDDLTHAVGCSRPRPWMATVGHRMKPKKGLMIVDLAEGQKGD